MSRKSSKKGMATLEYALLLPLILACIFVAIDVFLIFYQKTILQTFAENMAQSLARQWGYKPLPLEEAKTGVYKKSAYESREVYWHLKLWENNGKETAAENYIKSEAMKSHFLKAYEPTDGSKNGNRKKALEPEVNVTYKVGFPSSLKVSIKSSFYLPGAGLMRAIGLGELLIIEGNATAHVYDPKDMINNTDYVLQLLKGTTFYQKFIEKIAPLKQNIEKFIKKE